MNEGLLESVLQFITEHNWIVVFVMLVLTAGMVVGIGQLDTQSDASDSGGLPDTETSVAADYITDNYRQDDNQVAQTVVYVQDSDTVLSKDTLLDTLRFQQTVLENESVAAALSDNGIRSIASVIAAQLSTETTAATQTMKVDEQIAVIESASEAEVATAVRNTLTAESESLVLLPGSYEPGTTRASGYRIIFQFDADTNGNVPSDVQYALFSEAADRENPEYFTLGEHASAVASAQINENTMQLIVPAALVLILSILAFTYRDLIDVTVGMTGVVVSILWMFGILGWLGVGAGVTVIIGPVLIAGLSIDFSFHVFNRYREQRGQTDGIRKPMRRAIGSVIVGLGLVTVTAAGAFLSNLVNPIGMIRNMAIGITLGVLSAFLIYLTLVPALKISIEQLLARFGKERRQQPLGHGGYIRPVLRSSIVLAKRAAPVVIAVGLIIGIGGAAAWTGLAEKNIQTQTEQTADWKQKLPGPLAWEDPQLIEQRQYVQEEFRTTSVDKSSRVQILVQDEVTSDSTLQTLDDATDRPVFNEQRTAGVISPLTVIQSVADQNAEFSATVEKADTTGDGIPDTDLDTVYDHLYEVAPDQANQVIEQRDGEYRSLRIIGPASSAGPQDDRTDTIAGAATVIDQSPELTATPVSKQLVESSVLSKMTNGVLWVMLLALAVVCLGLILIFRYVHGSATIGAITGLPIALVMGIVIGGMYLLAVPLTLVTALLMSLVIGLGIDYNIHIADRFLEEINQGHSCFAALDTVVTGTGGALLGSALTSAAAFGSLLLHPHPQLESFGTLVILALLASFVVSVFILPSLLSAWWQYSTRDEPDSHPSQQPDGTLTD